MPAWNQGACRSCCSSSRVVTASLELGNVWDMNLLEVAGSAIVGRGPFKLLLRPWLLVAIVDALFRLRWGASPGCELEEGQSLNRIAEQVEDVGDGEENNEEEEEEVEPRDDAIFGRTRRILSPHST